MALFTALTVLMVGIDRDNEIIIQSLLPLAGETDVNQIETPYDDAFVELNIHRGELISEGDDPPEHAVEETGGSSDSSGKVAKTLDDAELSGRDGEKLPYIGRKSRNYAEKSEVDHASEKGDDYFANYPYYYVASDQDYVNYDDYYNYDARISEEEVDNTRNEDSQYETTSTSGPYVDVEDDADLPKITSHHTAEQMNNICKEYTDKCAGDSLCKKEYLGICIYESLYEMGQKMCKEDIDKCAGEIFCIKRALGDCLFKKGLNKSAQTTENEATRATEKAEVKIVGYQPDHYLAVGDSQIRICQMSGDGDSATLKWYKDGNEITNAVTKDPHVELNGNELFLTFNVVKEDDKGEYYCEVDGQKSGVENLHMYQSIKFTSNTSQFGELGTDHIIECQPTASPSPEVSWRRDFYPIKNSDKYEITREGLKVKNLTKADAGKYQCRAMISTPSETKNQIIDFDVVTNVTMPTPMGLSPAQPVVGSKVEITCKARGDPEPEYTLKRGEVIIQPSPNANGVWTINDLKQEDEANYICIATNRANSMKGFIMLNVQVAPKVTLGSEEVVSGVENQDTVLKCNAKGDPQPRFVWFLNGRKITDEYTPEETHGAARQLFFRNSSIALRLTHKHAGEWKCTAINKVGNHSKTIKVEVQYAPIVVDNLPTQVFGWKDGRIKLPCNFSGNPLPNLFWIKEGKLLTAQDTGSDGKLSYSTLTVTVVNESDFAEYECRADNDQGNKIHTVTLVKAQKPSPVIVSPTALTSTLILNVSPPSDDGTKGPKVNNYHVEYRESGSAADFETKNAIKESDDQAIKLEHLEPSKTYVVKVTGVSDTGSGQEVVLSLDTPRTSKPAQLVFVNKDNQELKSTKLNVEWTVKDDGSSPILNYNIIWEKVDENDAPIGEQKKEHIPGADKKDYALILDEGFDYLIRITATNSEGTSTPAQLKVKVPNGGYDNSSFPECPDGHWGKNCHLKDGCYYNGNRKGYLGSVDKTRTGRKCMNWSLQSPHQHIYGTKAADFPDGNHENAYCRAPHDEEKDHAPWCYTTDHSKRWEYCAVKDCECPAGYYGENCNIKVQSEGHTGPQELTNIPEFLPGPASYSYRVGEQATLRCSIVNLDDRQRVIWKRSSSIGYLSIGLTKFSEDPRLSAERQGRDWLLAIRDVQHSDAGVYECQVSSGMKHLRRHVTLQVLEPITKPAASPAKTTIASSAPSFIDPTKFPDVIPETPQAIHDLRPMYEVKAGDSVALMCSMVSIHSLKINCNNRRIDDKNIETTVFTDETGDTVKRLIMAKYNLPADHIRRGGDKDFYCECTGWYFNEGWKRLKGNKARFTIIEDSDEKSLKRKTATQQNTRFLDSTTTSTILTAYTYISPDEDFTTQNFDKPTTSSSDFSIEGDNLRDIAVEETGDSSDMSGKVAKIEDDAEISGKDAENLSNRAEKSRNDAEKFEYEAENSGDDAESSENEAEKSEEEVDPHLRPESHPELPQISSHHTFKQKHKICKDYMDDCDGDSRCIKKSLGICFKYLYLNGYGKKICQEEMDNCGGDFLCKLKALNICHKRKDSSELGRDTFVLGQLRREAP